MKPLTNEALASARQSWWRAAVSDYDLRYRMHGSEYVVRCRAGLVVEAMVDGRAAIRQACRTDLSPYGIEGLFDILELELENWSDPNGPLGSQARNVIVRVRFNDEMGYLEIFLRNGGMGRGAGIGLITFETV